MENSLNRKVEEIIESMQQDVEIIPPSIAEWWSRYLRQQKHRYIDLLSILEKSSDKGNSILEIGAVPGQLTIILKKLGYNITGADINPDRVQSLWSRHNIQVHKADIEQEPLPIPSDSYDEILFVEIIEHLRINPLYALREAYRVLKPGGRIILSTPNITPFDRIDFLFGKDYQEDPVEAFTKLETLGHMGHLRIYTFNEIQNFLKHVGFEVDSHAYMGRLIRIGWKAKLIMMLLFFKRETFHPYIYVFAKKPL